jgi:predicted CoA-binding protein
MCESANQRSIQERSLKPTIAIVGASADRAKFGNKAVRAYAQAGFHVYPVNPKESAIEGWPAFSSLSLVPIRELSRVSVYLPPKIGLAVLAEIAGKTVGDVWFNPGAESREILDKARELGLNVIAGCSIVALGVSPAEVDATT